MKDETYKLMIQTKDDFFGKTLGSVIVQIVRNVGLETLCDFVEDLYGVKLSHENGHCAVCDITSEKEEYWKNIAHRNMVIADRLFNELQEIKRKERKG